MVVIAIVIVEWKKKKKKKQQVVGDVIFLISLTSRYSVTHTHTTTDLFRDKLANSRFKNRLLAM